MKKILFLLIICFLLTGCSVTYDLKIDNDNLNENISVIIPKENLNKEFNILTIDEIFTNIYKYPTSLRYDDDMPGDSEYEKPLYGEYKIEKYSQNDNQDKELIANGNFSFNDYQYSNAVNTCYDTIVVKHNSSQSSFYTSSFAKCFDMYPLLEKITVNIELNNQVIRSNSDRIIDKVYTWNIDRTNYKDKTIELVFNSDSIVEDNNTSNQSFKILIYIILAVLLLFLIIFLHVKIKSKNANKL